jgi:hypothetical protein
LKSSLFPQRHIRPHCCPAGRFHLISRSFGGSREARRLSGHRMLVW